MECLRNTAYLRAALSPFNSGCIFRNWISTTARLDYIQRRTRLRVVDNSELGRRAMEAGKPPRVMHVYGKKLKAATGDMVMVAILGQKKRGFVVGARLSEGPLRPQFDSNNLVLLDDEGQPLGSRILAPVPSFLRSNKNPRLDYTKLLAIATKFV